MFGGEAQQNLPLLVQPASIDSLEPAYTCLAASNNFSAYGVGSSDSGWTSHLKAASDLYANLDTICGIPPTDSGFHMSFDHYFDNLSARLCHAKPLPCNASNPSLCVTQASTATFTETPEHARLSIALAVTASGSRSWRKIYETRCMQMTQRILATGRVVALDIDIASPMMEALVIY
jgi:hypothetical protein